MSVFLQGLGLQFFRGIGPEKQRIAPFCKFNFFVGENNSGKSTVLDFISSQRPFIDNPGKGIATEYRGRKTGKQYQEIGFEKQVVLERIVRKHSDFRTNSNLKSYIERIIEVISNNDLVWFKVDTLPQGASNTIEANIDECVDAVDRDGWYTVWQIFAGTSGGELKRHWVPQTLQAITQCCDTNFPIVSIIPTTRFIGEKDSTFTDLSGQGLIDRLAQLQSPDHDERHEYEDFQKINEFLRSFTGNEDAKIEVPHHREHVLVHMNNKVLPLASLGRLYI